MSFIELTRYCRLPRHERVWPCQIVGIFASCDSISEIAIGGTPVYLEGIGVRLAQIRIGQTAIHKLCTDGRWRGRTGE